MMKKFLYLLSLVFLLASCEEKDIDLAQLEDTQLEKYIAENGGAAELTDGIYFEKLQESTDPDARSVVDDKAVKIIYSAWLINEKRIVKAQTFYLIMGNGYYVSGKNVIEGMEIGLKKMKEGEKARLIVPSELSYGANGYGDVPAYSTIIYEIEVVSADLVNDEELAIAAFRENYKNETGNEIYYDNDNEIFFIKTVENDDEEEELPEEGETVTVTYEGYFLTGNPFDRNTLGFEVTLGNGSVVDGFDSAIMQLKVDESCTVILPSDQAYGTEGSGSSIAPYTPIAFDITRTE